jgi:hypothetical protein
VDVFRKLTGGPAFSGYQQVLDGFIRGKLEAAEQFASAFAPKTRIGIFLRNQVTKTFAVPAVADFVIGRTLLDRLDLPQYSMWQRAA